MRYSRAHSLPRTMTLISGPLHMIIFPITRSVRIRGRSPGLVGDRKMPTVANSKKPEPEAENRAGDRHRGRLKPQRGADHHNGCSGQSGDGVKIGAQHGGDLGQQHIAGHAAADPGQHAEEGRHDRWNPKVSAFCVPETAKSPSPAASNSSTGLRSWSRAEGRQKVAIPASNETA